MVRVLFFRLVAKLVLTFVNIWQPLKEKFEYGTINVRAGR